VGGFGDEVDAPAHVGGVPCGRLAALLGADARDDEPAYALPGEPDGQVRADHGGVSRLDHREIRNVAQLGQRAHETRGQRENAFRLRMQDLDDPIPARPGSVDQGLLPVEITGRVDFMPVGALSERFLRIDDQKGGVGHFLLRRIE
jgi:hypothetical protein